MPSKYPQGSEPENGIRVLHPVRFEEVGNGLDVDFRPAQRYEEELEVIDEATVEAEIEASESPKASTASDSATVIHPSVIPSSSGAPETLVEPTLTAPPEPLDAVVPAAPEAVILPVKPSSSPVVDSLDFQ